MAIQPESVPLHEDADGVVRISGTRVSLETVFNAFQAGATAEEIAARFDVLPLSDIYSVTSFCLRHPDDVAAYLRQRGEVARLTRERIADYTPGDVRSRLQHRRALGA